jgi:hypothetical protein
MTLKKKMEAREISRRANRLAINARIPADLKARGDQAIAYLGLKWVDVFMHAIEQVIELAAKKSRKKS